MRSGAALLFLACVAPTRLAVAFRKTKSTPSSTLLHFELPAKIREFSTSLMEHSDIHCGALTPSPFWTGTSRPPTSNLLRIPSGDKDWDNDLSVLLREPAIDKVWSKAMEVWDCKATRVAREATSLLSNEVPGLGGTTFQTVFDTLHAGGCPVWILGGSVRDLISAKSPKDVDTSALCQVSKIQRILSAKGWTVYTNPEYKYYEIGTRGAEDGMEGKSIADNQYSNPSTVDWTANMLLLDPIRMYVIDPSGRGISDAKEFRLTPATPPPLAWDAWYAWKAQETQPRYYRYLKFRLRGWQPYDDCFRYFIADEIVAALQKESTNPDAQMPMWLFLSQQLEDASKRPKIQKYLLYVLEEDLTRGYFEKDAKEALACGVTEDAKSTLRRKELKHASGLQWFKRTLVNECKIPPNTWNEIARRKRVNLRESCDLIHNFYKWARGGAYIKYKKGDAVFFKTRRGVFLEGFVSRVHRTGKQKRKQIDWSYDLVDRHGEVVQRKATAKRVLKRKLGDEV